MVDLPTPKMEENDPELNDICNLWSLSTHLVDPKSENFNTWKDNKKEPEVYPPTPEITGEIVTKWENLTSLTLSNSSCVSVLQKTSNTFRITLKDDRKETKADLPIIIMAWECDT